MKGCWHYITIALLGFILSLTLANHVYSQDNSITLIREAQQQYRQRQFNQSLELLERANLHFASEKKYLQQGQIQSLISLNYQQLGDWQQAQKAIDYGYALIATQKETSNKQQVLGQIWNTQGHLYSRKGEHQKALDCWNEAKKYYQNINDDIAVQGITITQAQALESLGFYRRSCSTVLEIFALKTQDCQQLKEEDLTATINSNISPSFEIQVEALSSLANNLMLLGKLQQAEEVINSSQKFFQQSNIESPSLQNKINFTSANVSQSIANLAKERDNLKLFTQETNKAIATYQDIINNSDSTLNIDILEAQVNLIDVHLKTNQWNLAGSLLEENQFILSQIPINYRTLKTKLLLANNLTTLKEKDVFISQSWDDLRQLYREIIQQSRSINNYYLESLALGELGKLAYENDLNSNINPISQIEQALNIAQTNQAPEIAYRWQWQLGKIYADRGNIDKAIIAYEAAFTTLQNLRNDLIALDREVQFSFRQQVEPVYREYTKLLLVKQPTQQIVATDNLKKARDVIEALQIAELDNYFKDACTASQKRDIEDIDPSAAVIYTIILPGDKQNQSERLEVILSLPDGSFHHHETVIDNLRLSSTVETLRSYLLQPDRLNDVNRLSHQVYKWLIEPLETVIAQSSSDVDTLVFVLDGELQNLPPSALYDGKQYLLEKYAIAITPGLRLLNTQSSSDKLTALAGGVSQSVQTFPPLENVAVELQRINSTIDSQNLLNSEFDRDNFTQAIDSQPFSVVHLATHGQFSSNPEQTFILLWDGKLTLEDFSYLLQNRNIENSQIIDLLVLSACETARGDRRAALGLAGMSVRTGVSSTLATLWQISDRSTALMMDNFYTYLSQNPQMSKAEALRLAQLDLWQVAQQDWQVPLFWAAYVIVGNWL